MDNRNLYRHTFYELKNWLKDSEDTLTNFYPVYAKQKGNIFDLGENNLYIYSSIVKRNESKILNSIEVLIADMCKQNNIGFEQPPVTICLRNERGDIRKKEEKDQLIITEKDLKVRLVFVHDSNSADNVVKYFLSKDQSYDALKIVILGNPEKSFYDMIIKDQNTRYKKE